MPLKILAWNFEPNCEVPDPQLQDDSLAFPAAAVRELKLWLQSTIIAQKTMPPTSQIIDLTPNVEAPIQFVGVPWKVINGIKWQHGQFEIVFKDAKTKMPLVRYWYVCARNTIGQCIVGAKLKHEIVGRIQ